MRYYIKSAAIKLHNLTLDLLDFSYCIKIKYLKFIYYRKYKLSSKVEKINFKASDSVLLICAHADDEVFGVNSICMQHIRNGGKVHWVVVNDGRYSYSKKFSPIELSKIRRLEANFLFKYYNWNSLYWHNHDSKKKILNDLHEKINTLVRINNINIIYIPSIINHHQEHRDCFIHILEISRKYNIEIRMYPLLFPMPSNLTNLLFVSNELEKETLDSFKIYESQSFMIKSVKKFITQYKIDKYIYNTKDSTIPLWTLSDSDITKLHNNFNNFSDIKSPANTYKLLLNSYSISYEKGHYIKTLEK